MPLYDHRGEPVREPALRQESARPARAGGRPWKYTSVASSLTPQKLGSMFAAADEGNNQELLTLATDIERRDPHAGAQLRTRKLALAGLPWKVDAASDADADVALAEELQAIVDRSEFAFLVVDLMDAVMKGYAVSEIEWSRGAKWSPTRFVWRDPRHFTLSKDDGTTLLLRTDAKPVDGEPMPAFKFISHVPRLASGPLATAGLVRPIAVCYSMKTLSVGSWLTFVELFGIPARLGTYPRGTTDDEVEALEKAIFALGVDAAGVMPEHVKIQLLDAIGKGNSTDAHEKLARWADEQVSKAVLGQTMTADSGASLSQAKVHQLVRRDILLADARGLEATLQRDLVQVFVDLNYGPRDVYPRIRCITDEPEDRASFVAAVKEMVDRGMTVEQSVVRDRLGLPEPEPGAEVLSPVRTAGAADSPPAPTRQAARVSAQANKMSGYTGRLVTKAEALAADKRGPPPGYAVYGAHWWREDGTEAGSIPLRHPAEQTAPMRRGEAIIAAWAHFAEVEGARDFIDEDVDAADLDAASAEVRRAVRAAADGANGFADFLARLQASEVDGDALVKSLATMTLQARGRGDATDEVT